MYAKLKNASAVGPSGEVSQDADSGPWHEIKTNSILAFAERVASCIGAPKDKLLLRRIMTMALSNGSEWFEHAGHRYTGEHVLLIYRNGVRQELPFEPFRTRAEWDVFAKAMRDLRDPSRPMLVARDSLLRMGETIEARQLPHAERNGWTS